MQEHKALMKEQDEEVEKLGDAVKFISEAS